MFILDEYFRLFDESRNDQKALKQLLDLFTPEAEIVLNGYKRIGFEGFIEAFYENNIDIKHMWEKWEHKQDGTYETNWAICGKGKDGFVYAKTGKDIARVNDAGKIIYLENVQADKNAFKKYE